MGKLLKKYKEKGWKESPRKLQAYERAKVKESANGKHGNGEWEEEQPKLVDPNTYPYDPEDDSHQYGGARTHAVSDISVMTKVNASETKDQDLKRALKWDENYGWDVVKTEIFNKEIRKVCGWQEFADLLGKDYADRCYYFFRAIKEWISFKGTAQIEDMAHAFVYFMCRFDNKPVSLFDFRWAYQDKLAKRKEKYTEKQIKRIRNKLPTNQQDEEKIKEMAEREAEKRFKDEDIKERMNNIKTYLRFFVNKIIWRRHICDCGFEWDDKLAGRNFDSLPEDFVCPDCGKSKKNFATKPVRQFKEQNIKKILGKFLNRLFEGEDYGIETERKFFLTIQSFLKDYKESIFKNHPTIGAFIYITLKNIDKAITQDEVAELCGCSTVTLREKINYIKENILTMAD